MQKMEKFLKTFFSSTLKQHHPRIKSFNKKCSFTSGSGKSQIPQYLQVISTIKSSDSSTISTQFASLSVQKKKNISSSFHSFASLKKVLLAPSTSLFNLTHQNYSTCQHPVHRIMTLQSNSKLSWTFTKENAPIAALCLYFQKTALFEGKGYPKPSLGQNDEFTVSEDSSNVLKSSVGIAAYLLGPEFALKSGSAELKALEHLIEAKALLKANSKQNSDSFKKVISDSVLGLCKATNESSSFLELYTLEALHSVPGLGESFSAEMNKLPFVKKALELINSKSAAPAPANEKAGKKEKNASGPGQQDKPAKKEKEPSPLPKAYPTGFILDEYRSRISERIGAMLNIEAACIFAALEKPKSLDNGDIALAVAKLRLKDSPMAASKRLAETFTPDDLIAKAVSAGPYLNFTVNKKKLTKDVILGVLENSETFGRNELLKGKTIIVEFSSPNIAKPFHAGHLRSTIIGNFLKQLFRFCGAEVIGMNYLGDWGKQYGLLALGFEKFGNEDELKRDPIRHLFDVYVKINEEASSKPEIHDLARDYFKRMEMGDKEALGMWRRFRDLSIEKYKQIYARLNVEFDVYSGESTVEEEMKESLRDLKAKNLLKQSEGAWIADLNEHGLGVAVLEKSNGTTLYLTRDVAAAETRKKTYNFDEMFYVVAAAQDLHLKQLFKLLEIAGHEWSSKLTHINFGLVKGMSTRKGTVVFLEDILDAAKEEMHNNMKANPEKYALIQDPEGTADILGLSAVVIQDMSARRIKDYNFDLKRFTSFEGDTGPYVQYAHSRLCSIQRRCGFELPPADKLASEIKFDLLEEETVFRLIDQLAQFPEIVANAAKTQEPCTIVNYLMSLSHSVMAAFETLWVINREKDIALARLSLFAAAQKVVCNGLKLLGIKPLERM